MLIDDILPGVVMTVPNGASLLHTRSLMLRLKEFEPPASPDDRGRNVQCSGLLLRMDGTVVGATSNPMWLQPGQLVLSVPSAGPLCDMPKCWGPAEYAGVDSRWQGEENLPVRCRPHSEQFQHACSVVPWSRLPHRPRKRLQDRQIVLWCGCGWKAWSGLAGDLTAERRAIVLLNHHQLYGWAPAPAWEVVV